MAPKSFASLRKAIPVWLEDTSDMLTSCFKQLLRSLWDDLRYLDERMKELNDQIKQIAQNNPVTKRLKQLQGVGDLVSTALVANVGDATQFRKGRDMAAALGLTPRQHSSGGKNKLLGISKRGNSYLRFLLIQGARSAMRTAKGKDDRFSRWVASLQGRRHPNVVAVAMANKIVRMAWAMMTKGTDYDPNYETAVMN